MLKEGNYIGDSKRCVRPPGRCNKAMNSGCPTFLHFHLAPTPNTKAFFGYHASPLEKGSVCTMEIRWAFQAIPNTTSVFLASCWFFGSLVQFIFRFG